VKPASSAPLDARPLLWLRARSTRSVLDEHLRHVAASFSAAGWSVVTGTPPDVAPGAAVAVMDDPWVEPLPRLASALARVRVPGSPLWRVPRVYGLSGRQGWHPAVPPSTMAEYERRTVRRGPARTVFLGNGAWIGFAVAAAGEAAPLLRDGWPPREAALVTNAFLYRYADPSAHDRRELTPFVPASAKTVIDVGCGTGLLGSLLRHDGRRVVGIEPEWELARAASRNLDVVVPARAEEGLSAIRAPVDCIVFADVLEHTVAPQQLLRAGARLIGPSGRIVVSFPNAAWAPVLRGLASGRWDPTLAGVQARDHLFYTTPRSFATVAAECGLAVETLAPLDTTMSWWVRAWGWLAALTAGGKPSETAASQWVAVLRPR
jgi:2-polyprenyl-3-methyl-5-hydroxy-6-metoxy-1,4-benzoquinol methylase